MRTRLKKLLRGGVCTAFAMSGLGVIGALGAGLATSSVAGATGASVTSKLACTADSGLKQLALLSGFKVTTSTVTMKIGTTRSVTIVAHMAVTPALVTVAINTGHLHTLTVSGATLTVTLSGFTHTATRKITQTGSVTVPLVAHASATATLNFKFTVEMTAATGVTATIKAGPKFTTTILVPVNCKTENTTFRVATWPKHTVAGTPTVHVPIATVTAVPQGPIDTIKSSGYAALSLTPATGTRLTAGQVGKLYTHGSDFWTASGGHLTYTWHATTATQDGLTFSSTGDHASITGTPTTAEATVCWSVSVITNVEFAVTFGGTPLAALAGDAIIHHEDCMTITPPPATPIIIQPFKLTVTPGTLTLTCTSASTGPKPGTGGSDHTPTPYVAGPKPVADHADTTTQSSASNCAEITLGHVKLAEHAQLITARGHGLIISTSRGAADNSWALYAVMTPSATSLTHDAYCGYVQGFCDVTTTLSMTEVEHHLANTSILPNYLTVAGYHCSTNTTATTPYYNTNPEPTTTTGQTVKTPAGLSAQYKLCSAATGYSGGEFFVETLDYSLVVPPNIYAGTYYGTVQYTLTLTVLTVPAKPITPEQ